MKIKSQKDFFSGLMFLVVGSSFAWGSTTYKIGSSAHMGSGYLPLLLGIILALLGAAISVKALVRPMPGGDKVGHIAWKPLLFIVLANLVFGACIGGLPGIGLPPLGMFIGIMMLTVIASYGGEEFKVTEALILGLVFCVVSYLVFIMLLKLQFPVWPAFVSA